MGVGSSTANKLDKALATDLPENERYFGLENALYFCEPFRKQVLIYDKERKERLKAQSERKSQGTTGQTGSGGSLKSAVKGMGSVISLGGNPPQNGNSNPPNRSNSNASSTSVTSEDTLLTALGDLFTLITTQKKRTGSVPPKAFITRLRQENELFSSYMHQDAHEFLNYVLNRVVENLNKEALAKRRRSRVNEHEQTNGTHAPSSVSATGDEQEADDDDEPLPKTFVHDLFEGQLSNETKCLCCERVTQRVEPFLDVSVDIAQNSSLTSCLRNFSSTELLNKGNKFYCDACCSYQEAEKRISIKKLPRILALTLKRFKYVEQMQKFKKLSYRVVFPLEYRLNNVSDDSEDADRFYNLFAVVVHVGSGPNHGHYVSLIKSHGQWLLFDDDCVEPKDESELQGVFGCTQDFTTSTESGYILFYESVNASS